MRNKSGFTLIELMVTIALIAIIMGGTIPAMITWRNNAQLSRGARQIYSDLQNARKMAIKNNRLAGVSFNVSGNKYVVFLDINDAGGAIGTFDLGNDQVIDEKTLPPNVELDSADFTTFNNVAIFNNLGFARGLFNNTENDGSVTVRRAGGSGRTSTISVGTGGNISIQ